MTRGAFKSFGHRSLLNRFPDERTAARIIYELERSIHTPLLFELGLVSCAGELETHFPSTVACVAADESLDSLGWSLLVLVLLILGESPKVGF